MKDYYKILGVTHTASAEEIKKAYRKLAHQYHPDKKGGDEARFKEISEAYQILSDQQKRAQYDQFGSTGGPGGGGNPAGWDFGNFRGFEDMDMGDIFETFFGGGRQGGGGGFSWNGGSGVRARRGRDISIDIEVPFAESVFGGERRVLIRKRTLCAKCDGTGAQKGSKEIACSQCHGAGTIRDTKRSFFGSFTQVVECSQCEGRGKVPEKRCSECSGSGVIPKSEEIRIVVPPGIEHGEVIRMAQKGEALRGGEAGDLYVKVHVLPHPTFKRLKNDLLMRLDTPLSLALAGGSREVELIDGPIKVKIPQGISDGEILKVNGKGIPRDDGSRGDLLIEVKIKMPKKLTASLKALVEELQKEGN